MATPKLLFGISGALALCLLAFLASRVQAQGPLPRNDPARGLVYDGLEPGTPTECGGVFKLKTKTGRTRCTHGPDPMLRPFDRAQTILRAPASASAPSTVQCDGDGVSGKRVQVLYAHADNAPDNFATYQITLTNYVIGMDGLFDTSAAQTGGTRHLRFVHDVNCVPIITDVTLIPAGTLSLLNTINELEAQGYNSTERKYIVFMDASVYCGISIMSFDDRWDGYNANNIGDTFGRIDRGCWSDVIAAHELMHQLGAVQIFAPHSASETHCYDGFDNMCRPTNGTVVQEICTYPNAGNLFDCNHDDYYSTDAAVGSYLNTHWNTAVNQFFILPSSVRVGSLQTLQESDTGLAPTDVFSFSHNVYAQAVIVDQYNLPLANATVNLSINESNNNPLCALSVQTDGDGIAEIICSLTGTFSSALTARVNSFSFPSYPNDTAHSALLHPFNVFWVRIFPLVFR